jgi:hypothetical protein
LDSSEIKVCSEYYAGNAPELIQEGVVVGAFDSRKATYQNSGMMTIPKVILAQADAASRRMIENYHHSNHRKTT